MTEKYRPPGAPIPQGVRKINLDDPKCPRCKADMDVTDHGVQSTSTMDGQVSYKDKTKFHARCPACGFEL